jgi:acetyl-CoA carboxylase carboxyltransferase component
MGPEQLAGVMSIVARQAAESAGRAFDEDADAKRRIELEERVEAESLAMHMSGQIYDDGIIDPRDTRTVLGMSLSIAHNNTIQGTRGYGVFRM